MKKALAVVLTAGMVAGLAACGGSQTSETTAAAATAETTAAAAAETAAAGETAAATEAAAPAAREHDGTKIFKGVETYPYASLDPHVDYQAWHTQYYGITESLFRIAEDLSIQPWLADSMEVDGTKNTITLKDGICFSNGNPVTADMVVKNLQRLAEKNVRYEFFNDFTYDCPDDKTIVIETPQPMPSLKNELASAETDIIDLDNTTDFDANPIGTGPFVVDTFVPEGDVSVKYNENYWGGDVYLDGAMFYFMKDEEAKLMAMQNGEIDGYVDVAASSREIYEQDPDSYTLTTVPTERRCYAFINSKIPDSVRHAICIGVDKDQLALYMNGLVAATQGAFTPGTYYGNVQPEATNIDEAKKILEDDGYTLNADGIYEKDGQPISLPISCYAARSVDTISLLLSEQLKNIGIDAPINLVENCDGTYMSDHNFDIGMYVSITDKAGEPSAFIRGALLKGSYQDVAGFGNDKDDELINKLTYETDQAKQTELIDELMTDCYDSHMIDFLCQYSKTSVLRAGASGIGENHPGQFYGLSATTVIPD